MFQNETILDQKNRDISRLLVAWNGGDEAALQELITLVYPELRRIAQP